MDVAAFVGFASAGPVDVPVPVEDIARFRDIFGADPQLAWDHITADWAHGLLGPSVEAFFANGGGRCWVVRVADAPAYNLFDFGDAGVIATDDSRPELRARVRARAPGSWADELSVAARAEVEALARLRADWFEVGGDLGTATALDRWTRPRGKGPLTLELPTPVAALVPGDLLRLQFLPEDLVLFMVVGRP